jgi:3-hydroxyisobutyrate dehydrogenase
MKVTILGAGAMGSAMALRLIDTGHQVTVWNRSRERLTPLADAGAAIADDVATAVADAAVLITMLTDGEAVRSVAEQLLLAMRTDAVWVQASTIGADWADRIRELADEAGRALLDAPVSGWWPAQPRRWRPPDRCSTPLGSTSSSSARNSRPAGSSSSSTPG